MKADVKLSLCSHSPFRSGEINRVRSERRHQSSCSVHHIERVQSPEEPKAFTRQRPAGRYAAPKTSFPCSAAEQVSTQKSGYLWLLDDPDRRFSDVAELDYVLGQALRIATGEGKARIHCLRGAAVARDTTPTAEDVLVSTADGASIGLPTSSADDREWLAISIAARQARHSRP